MSILIDEGTKVIVQGITGREGQFHSEQMLAYGTRIVAGVTPGKGGQEVHGVSVYNTVREAMEHTQADASVLFVPARFVKDSVTEAIEAEVPLVITIAEHVPVQDMMFCRRLARDRGVQLVGPNSFGIIAPGKCKIGFMAHRIFLPGHVGLMSRSATNCYETVFMLSQKGVGQSVCVGVGGDMIPGSTFIDVLPELNADGNTRAIVLIGEIGGNEEELAAEYIKEHVKKPVVAVITGKNAPKGRSMGHAGAIVSADGTGSAQNKELALQDAGVHVAESTRQVAEILFSLREEYQL